MINASVAAFFFALILGACNNSQSPASPVAERTPVPSTTPPPAPLTAAVPAVPTAPSMAAQLRTFDDDAVSRAPAGFSFGRTGSGRQGQWVVRAEPGAPSGAHVLAQLDADDTDSRFPVAVMNDPSLRDVRVSVRCKMVSGRVDQACGLVARYKDENNYFITRANALEGNIRLYTVEAGERHQLASWSGAVTPNVWHALQLDVRGDHLEVFWDGQRVMDEHDSTFAEAGRVGVWTKADSIASFDDLRAEPL